MSRKFLPVLALLIGVGSFLTFRTMGRNDKGSDNPRSKFEKILRNVGVVLEGGHYSPKDIDDKFSKSVLKKYLTDLDGEKYIFLQKDIDGFNKYSDKIDDEIKGSKLESFFDVSTVYTSRLEEVSKMYQTILSRPLDYSKDENIVLDENKRTFPKTEKEREDFNRRRLKYLVLSRYADMLEEKEKNSGKEGYVVKADTTLEREARVQVLKQLDRYFATLKSHNKPEELFSDFVNAITTSMDPHTSYFAPVDKRSFDELLSGKFYGIGAQLKEDDGKIKIASLVGGGPAWKSGNVQVEDEIVKIAQAKAEPVDVTGYSVTDAVKLIRGAEKNSEVRLTLKKADGTFKVVSLLRDVISLEETFVKSSIITGQHKIGYIYLPEFYADFNDPNGRRCATDVAKEIEKLKAENVDGIIMDLRGNGGGSLYDVVDMAGLFIEDGPICQVKGRNEKPMVMRDRDKSVLYSGPLTVMVDEFSASASEIFAAAIQDYKRGLIIGSTSTYGKGTVQRSISLDPDIENQVFNKKPAEGQGLGDVKLTFRKFYRINGGATQLKGVTPDIVIPDRYEFYKIREKDNPDALSWDEINQAPYNPWNPGYNVSTVVTNAKKQLETNPTFKLVREDVQLLEKLNDKDYSLNLKKFREEQTLIRSTSKKLDGELKLTVDLNVTNPAADLPVITATKDKTDKNKAWLGKVSDDIYIEQTVKIMENMITDASLAKIK